MALQRQNLSLNFVKGADTKTDPKQLPLGKWERMENSNLVRTGSTKKRFGFDTRTIDVVPSGTLSQATNLLKFKDQLLVSDGLNAYSFSPESGGWVGRGALTPLETSVTPLTQTAYNQKNADYVQHSSGMVGFCYQDDRTNNAFYVIKDGETGAILVPPTTMTNSLGGGNAPRAAVVGAYIVFVWLDSVNNTKINYVGVDTANPTGAAATGTVTAPVGISNLIGVLSGSNGRLYVSLADIVTPRLRVFYLDTSLTPSSVQAFTTGSQINQGASFLDSSNNVWTTYLQTGEIHYLIVASDLLSTILADTDTNIACDTIPRGAYDGTVGRVVFGVAGNGTNSATSNLVSLSSAGTVGTPSLLQYGVTLFAAPFVEASRVYVPYLFISTLQTSVFLVRDDGAIVSKCLYGAAVTDNVSLLPLVKRGVNGSYYLPSSSIDELTTVQGRVVTQQGLSLIEYSFNSPDVKTSLEVANNLHVGGSFLSMFDGNQFVEHGFHIFPEGVQVTSPASLTITGSTNSTAVVTITGLNPFIVKAGQRITGTNISANTFINSVNATAGTITLSQTASGTGSGITFTVSGGGLSAAKSYQYFAIYEWTDYQGNRFLSAPSPVQTVLTATGTTLTVTGTSTTTSTSFTGISPSAPVFKGQRITSANFPAGTYIVDKQGTTLTMSLAATGTGSTSFTTTDTVGNTIDVPTLKQTAKLSANTPVIISLYRTEGNNTTPYRITSVTAPLVNNASLVSLRFYDTTPDLDIVGNEILYTTGGVVENIPVPPLRHVSSFKKRAIVVPTNNGSTFWFSKTTAPGVPVEFSDLFTYSMNQKGGELVASAEMDDKLILFKDTLIFYSVGDGPTATGAGSSFAEPLEIQSDVGCPYPRSIVSTPIGLIFRTHKGIYLLSRGLQVQYIGAPVEQYNNLTIVRAHLADTANEVRFFTEEGTTLVYDYYLGEWYTHPEQSAVDSIVYERKFLFLSSNAEVHQENDAYTDDGAAIEQRYTTGWISTAGIQGFQRISELEVLGEYVSPHSLTISIYVDYEDAPIQVREIVVSDNKPYEYNLTLTRQKCTALKIDVQENQVAPFGEGMRLSALSFTVGVKGGLNRMPAKKSF